MLAAGDTLYLPRGWPHHAQTSGEQSLHVTTGLQPPRRVDALHAALDACAAQDVELRRALDAGGALPADLLARVAPFLEPAAVADRARRAFVDDRRPLREDALHAHDPVAAEDPVQRRDTVIADLEGTALRFEGRAVRFPAHTSQALTAAYAAEGPFTAASLPGPLDQAGRLELVRRLLQEGFLRRAARNDA